MQSSYDIKQLSGVANDRFRRKWEDVDWTYLAQDRDQWLVLVNTATNLRLP
jgi:hypothetical protein